MAIVFVFLGLAGGAFWWNVADKSSEASLPPPETSTAVPAESAASTPDCKQTESFCTMQFQPSKCTLKSKGVVQEFAGNNLCQAKQQALKALCAGGASAHGVLEWNTLSCNQISD